MKAVEFTEAIDLGVAGVGAGFVVLSPFFPPLAIIGADMIIGGGSLYAIKRGTLHGREERT